MSGTPQMQPHPLQLSNTPTMIHVQPEALPRMAHTEKKVEKGHWNRLRGNGRVTPANVMKKSAKKVRKRAARSPRRASLPKKGD